MIEDGRTIQRQVQFECTARRLWSALTDPDDLGHWLCEQAFFRAEDGAPYRWEWGGGLHADGNIIGFEPGRSLRVTYRVPAFPVSLTSPTQLEFSVRETTDTQSILAVTHAGFGHDAEWTPFFRGHEQSWDIDLAELRELVEGRELEEVRRLEVSADPSKHAKILERVASSPSPHGGGLHATARSDDSTIHAFTTPSSVIVTVAVPDEDLIDELVESARAVLRSMGTGDVQVGSPYG